MILRTMVCASSGLLPTAAVWKVGVRLEGSREGALEGQATAPTDPRTPRRWAPCHLSVVEAFDACVFLEKWEMYQKLIFLSSICVGASSWWQRNKKLREES